MKNITLSACLTFCSVVSFFMAAPAQNFYARIHTGYAFGTSNAESHAIDMYNYTYNSTAQTVKYEVVKLSLGKGFSAGLNVGYMFNPFLGADLGASYLLGGKTTTTHEEIYSNGTHKSTVDCWSEMVRLSPSVVVSAGMEKFSPYAKFGVIFGFGSVTIRSEEVWAADVTVGRYLLDEGLAFGYTAAAGVNYSISERYSVFAEVQTVNMSYGPTHGELVEYTVNGVDQLPFLTVSDKETVYVDSYTLSSSTPSYSGWPQTELKMYFPFGSIGANFGFRMNF